MENIIQTIAFIVQAAAAIAIWILSCRTAKANEDLVKITEKVFEENAKMTKVTEQLFEAQDKPFVAVTFGSAPLGDAGTIMTLIVENIGTGPAYWVDIKFVSTFDRRTSLLAMLPPFTTPIPLLSPNRPKIYPIGAYEDSKTFSDEITITYTDSRQMPHSVTPRIESASTPYPLKQTGM